MGLTHRNQNSMEDPFTLTVDQYGRVWLHAKLEGLPVAIDLAEKTVAFKIMAETMAENGFEPRQAQSHDKADNDDQLGR